MKIVVLKSADRTRPGAARIQTICAALRRLGYDLLERTSGASLLSALRLDAPDVVFNLASVYGADYAHRLPAVFEIAGVPYTGSGILALGLAQTYSQLYPLLSGSGVAVPPFRLAPAGRPLPAEVSFPLTLRCDGRRDGQDCENTLELERAWRSRPAETDCVLQARVRGRRLSLYLLDGLPFPAEGPRPCLPEAQRAFRLMEARGLARFDFVLAEGDRPLLEAVDAAPDPLDEHLLNTAEGVGWNLDRVLQALVQHSALDETRCAV
jgi:D-alanine-D-alanine ligase-like ATP-grasp enzyme